MNYLKYGAGIDMALEKFDVCLSLIDDLQKVVPVASCSFSNNPKGFCAFKQWIAKHQKHALPIVFLVEATGIYHEQLAWYLFEHECCVVVMLPNKAKKYKEALGLKSKNDTIDAAGLAAMACQQHLKPWQPISKNIYKMRVITRQIEALATRGTVIKNQLHALQHGMYRITEVEKSIKKQIVTQNREKENLEIVLLQLVENDVVLKTHFENILKIKGLGFLSLATIVAETDGFALTENQSQITSYAGYDVVENQSGNRIGKTKISKKGNGHIRRALHFPALNVVRYNQANFKGLFDRIYLRSNIKMKGYVAVQRKLLCLIYTLWKTGETFIGNANQQNSGDKEAGPSFASASQKPDSQNDKSYQKNETGKQGQQSSKPKKAVAKSKAKRASTKVKAPLDKLPLTSQRKPSFA